MEQIEKTVLACSDKKIILSVKELTREFKQTYILKIGKEGIKQ